MTEYDISKSQITDFPSILLSVSTFHDGNQQLHLTAFACLWPHIVVGKDKKILTSTAENPLTCTHKKGTVGDLHIRRAKKN